MNRHESFDQKLDLRSAGQGVKPGKRKRREPSSFTKSTSDSQNAGRLNSQHSQASVVADIADDNYYYDNDNNNNNNNNVATPSRHVAGHVSTGIGSPRNMHESSTEENHYSVGGVVKDGIRQGLKISKSGEIQIPIERVVTTAGVKVYLPSADSRVAQRLASNENLLANF